MTGVVRDCTHPRASHKHGTYLAHRKDGCRCDPCCSARRRAAKATAYRTVTGTHSYVPAGPARAHLEQLLGVLTVGQVEQRSGVNRTAVRLLVGDIPGRPASKRITRTTETAILQVSADLIGPEQSGLVDGIGTRRRIRGLIAMGWTAKHIADRLGLSSRTAWFLTSSAIDMDSVVRVSTRDAVRRLYDEMCLTIPPAGRTSTRARRIAAARGWAPPLAWDDDTIDDPTAAPAAGDDEDQVDELAVEAVCDGHRIAVTGATLHAAVQALAERGMSIEDTAERLLTTTRQVSRLRKRATSPRAYRTAA